MKEIYTKPEAEIEEFAVAEILTESEGTTIPDGNENLAPDGD